MTSGPLLDGSLECTLAQAAWAALDDVADPEIPVLSVVDLGMIRRVRVEPGPVLVVEMMPTFLGCPAIGAISEAITHRLSTLAPVAVAIVRDQAWTSARITDDGRRKLVAAGMAAPPTGELLQLAELQSTACPFCGSADTRLESPFGPTACRSIHYCRVCRQPFEQFKAV